LLTPNKIELIPYPKQFGVYTINHYGEEKLAKYAIWLSYFEKNLKPKASITIK